MDRKLSDFGMRSRLVDPTDIVPCSPRWWFGSNAEYTPTAPDTLPAGRSTDTTQGAGVVVVSWASVDEETRRAALMDAMPDPWAWHRVENRAVPPPEEGSSVEERDHVQRLALFSEDREEDVPTSPQFLCLDGRTVVLSRIASAGNAIRNEGPRVDIKLLVEELVPRALLQYEVPLPQIGLWDLFPDVGGPLTKTEAKYIAVEIGAAKMSQKQHGIMDLLDYAAYIQDQVVKEKGPVVGRGAVKLAVEGGKGTEWQIEAHKFLRSQFLRSEAFKQMTMRAKLEAEKALFRAASDGTSLIRTCGENVLGANDSPQRRCAQEQFSRFLLMRGGMDADAGQVNPTTAATLARKESVVRANRYLRLVENMHDLPISQVMLKLMDLREPGILKEHFLERHSGGLFGTARSDVGVALFLFWYYEVCQKTGEPPFDTVQDLKRVLALHEAMLLRVEHQFEEGQSTEHVVNQLSVDRDLLRTWSTILSRECLPHRPRAYANFSQVLPVYHRIMPPHAEPESPRQTSRAASSSRGGVRGQEGSKTTRKQVSSRDKVRRTPASGQGGGSESESSSSSDEGSAVAARSGGAARGSSSGRGPSDGGGRGKDRTANVAPVRRDAGAQKSREANKSSRSARKGPGASDSSSESHSDGASTGSHSARRRSSTLPGAADVANAGKKKVGRGPEPEPTVASPSGGVESAERDGSFSEERRRPSTPIVTIDLEALQAGELVPGTVLRPSGIVSPAPRASLRLQSKRQRSALALTPGFICAPPGPVQSRGDQRDANRIPYPGQERDAPAHAGRPVDRTTSGSGKRRRNDTATPGSSSKGKCRTAGVAKKRKTGTGKNASRTDDFDVRAMLSNLDQDSESGADGSSGVESGEETVSAVESEVERAGQGRGRGGEAGDAGDAGEDGYKIGSNAGLSAMSDMVTKGNRDAAAYGLDVLFTGCSEVPCVASSETFRQSIAFVFKPALAMGARVAWQMNALRRLHSGCGTKPSDADAAGSERDGSVALGQCCKSKEYCNANVQHRYADVCPCNSCMGQLLGSRDGFVITTKPVEEMPAYAAYFGRLVLRTTGVHCAVRDDLREDLWDEKAPGDYIVPQSEVCVLRAVFPEAATNEEEKKIVASEGLCRLASTSDYHKTFRNLRGNPVTHHNEVIAGFVHATAGKAMAEGLGSRGVKPRAGGVPEASVLGDGGDPRLMISLPGFGKAQVPLRGVHVETHVTCDTVSGPPDRSGPSRLVSDLLGTPSLSCSILAAYPVSRRDLQDVMEACCATGEREIVAEVVKPRMTFSVTNAGMFLPSVLSRAGEAMEEMESNVRLDAQHFLEHVSVSSESLAMFKEGYPYGYGEALPPKTFQTIMTVACRYSAEHTPGGLDEEAVILAFCAAALQAKIQCWADVQDNCGDS